MKNNKLFQTNLLVSSILVVGFILTAFFCCRANYRASLENIEQVWKTFMVLCNKNAHIKARYLSAFSYLLPF